MLASIAAKTALASSVNVVISFLQMKTPTLQAWAFGFDAKKMARRVGGPLRSQNYDTSAQQTQTFTFRSYFARLNFGLVSRHEVSVLIP
jgi:hypothetical protein